MFAVEQRTRRHRQAAIGWSLLLLLLLDLFTSSAIAVSVHTAHVHQKHSLAPEDDAQEESEDSVDEQRSREAAHESEKAAGLTESSSEMTVSGSKDDTQESQAAEAAFDRQQDEEDRNADDQGDSDQDQEQDRSSDDSDDDDRQADEDDKAETTGGDKKDNHHDKNKKQSSKDTPHHHRFSEAQAGAKDAMKRRRGMLGSIVAAAKGIATSIKSNPAIAAGVALGAGALFGGLALLKKFLPKPKERDPEVPDRSIDPKFDSLDMPWMCPESCNRRGKCLIDRSRKVRVGDGRVEIHPYKCHCKPQWAGTACQTRVDQYLRWFESNGTTPFPQCCNVCPAQFRVPTNYANLPVYQNPYSVTNCDPQLSIDSRPENGRPPCWRPLSAEPYVDLETGESGDALDANKPVDPSGAATFFLETLARAGVHPREVEWGDFFGRDYEHTDQSAAARQQSLGLIEEYAKEVYRTAPALVQIVSHTRGVNHFRMRGIMDKIKGFFGGKKEAAAAPAAASPSGGGGSDDSAAAYIEKKKKEMEENKKQWDDHMAKIAEENQKDLELRLKYQMPECCIFCDFDYWTEVNSRPAPPRTRGRGRSYLRALERQRIVERVGANAMTRELDRRERLRTLEEENFRQRISKMEAEEASFLELDTSTQRLEHREGKGFLSFVGNLFKKKETKKTVSKKCCAVCPVPADPPLENPNPQKFEIPKSEDSSFLEMEEQLSGEPRRTAPTEENNRFGSFLRRGRQKRVSTCCKSCPSQFYLRTVSLDLDPFYGPEAKLVKKQVTSEPPAPTEQQQTTDPSADPSQQQQQQQQEQEQ